MVVCHVIVRLYCPLCSYLWKPFYSFTVDAVPRLKLVVTDGLVIYVFAFLYTTIQSLLKPNSISNLEDNHTYFI